MQEHKGNVKKGLIWLRENLSEVLELAGRYSDLSWQIEMSHDFSKNDPEEYDAYDAYFYGKNRSYEVVQNFNYAWLRHIHLNPHHWQYWVLINDDPKDGEIIMDMPYNYIIEMICYWWSFSWKAENLTEIFKWYDEYKDYIKLSDRTRKTVEDILQKMSDLIEPELFHHGIKGQKWGERNGPPYPLKDKGKRKLKNSAGNDIIIVEHVELIGPPNSITQIIRKHGGIDRNFYNEEGKQIKQISNYDHGHPKNHKYGDHGEHSHDYIYDKNGKLIGRPDRNLTIQERKENGDFL